MNSLRVRPLVSAASLAALIALAGCAGAGSPAKGPAVAPGKPSAGKVSASTPPAADSSLTTQVLPAGYQWVTSVPQNMGVAVPAGWVALDMSRLTVAAALSKLSFDGVSPGTVTANLDTAQRVRGLFFADPGSAAGSPHRFVASAYAYCQSPGFPAGPATASNLDTQFRSEWADDYALVLSLENTTVSSSKVVIMAELRVQVGPDLKVIAGVGYPVTEFQVASLNDQGRLCYVALLTSRPSAYLPTFREIAGTLDVG